MADIRRIPFTEMFERLQKELIRDNSSAEGTYKGRINDVYMYDIPGQIDWRHIRETGTVTTIDDYSTGYITDISSTTVTGDSDCDWEDTDNFNNMLLKVGGNNEVYRVTYSSSTALTLDRTWVETAISDTDTSYRLVQDRYALAAGFNRMVLNPDQAVYYWKAGTKIPLEYKPIDELEMRQTVIPGDPHYYTLKWIDGSPYIYIDPPANDARTLYYDYIPTFARMTEYTTGTITTLASAGTEVTGSSTDFDGFVSDTTNYDYYFRIDSDGTGGASKWYAISSATDDDTLVLSDAYEGTAISSGTSTYTISKCSLLPSGLDLAIMYKAALVSATDQTNPTQIKSWAALYSEIVGAYKAVESKKGYAKQRVHTIYEKPGVRR